MVASLLFLALAFFAVGQAGATRNGAQSAADAAALAAAQESRDRLGDALLPNLLKPGYLEGIFNDDLVGSDLGCAAAGSFADKNGANVDACGPAAQYMWGTTVSVITQKPMGDSILPGTENERATADATAIVEPRCTFKPAEAVENPENDPAPDDGKPVSPGEFACDDRNWDLDPEHPDLLPDMADLFTVRLAQD